MYMILLSIIGDGGVNGATSCPNKISSPCYQSSSSVNSPWWNGTSWTGIGYFPQFPAR